MSWAIRGNLSSIFSDGMVADIFQTGFQGELIRLQAKNLHVGRLSCPIYNQGRFLSGAECSGLKACLEITEFFVQYVEMTRLS
jgi:hypothetical protein